jgi:hypothetical protein
MGSPTCFDPQEFGPGGDPQVKDIANIPAARDLPSAISAVNNLRSFMYNMLNPSRGGNGAGPGGGFKIKPSKRSQNQKKIPRWREINRTVRKRRIYNPQDREQYVDVEEITMLVMQNDLTHEVWVWKR